MLLLLVQLVLLGSSMLLAGVVVGVVAGVVAGVVVGAVASGG